MFVYLDRVDEGAAALRRQVATTAHELRGPVTVIRGLAETLLAGGRRTWTTTERSRVLDAIAQQARLLDNVAADLLTQAQAAARQPADRGDRRRPAPRSCASHGRASSTRSPSTSTTRAPCVADPHRLEQMVHNLVSNARKYGRAPYAARVRTAADPAYVCIDVVDHGPGVPEAVPRPAVRRVHPGRADAAAEGVGLGLYVVRVLANAQGGDVDYADGPDGGAVFTLTLPAGVTARPLRPMSLANRGFCLGRCGAYHR